MRTQALQSAACRVFNFLPFPLACPPPCSPGPLLLVPVLDSFTQLMSGMTKPVCGRDVVMKLSMFLGWSVRGKSMLYRASKTKFAKKKAQLPQAPMFLSSSSHDRRRVAVHVSLMGNDPLGNFLMPPAKVDGSRTLYELPTQSGAEGIQAQKGLLTYRTPTHLRGGGGGGGGGYLSKRDRTRCGGAEQLWTRQTRSVASPTALRRQHQ